MRLVKAAAGLLALGVLVGVQTKPAATKGGIRTEMARLKLPRYGLSAEGIVAFRAVADRLREEEKVPLMKAIGEWRAGNVEDGEFVELCLMRWELMSPPVQQGGAVRRMSRAVSAEAYSADPNWGQQSFVGRLRHLEYHVTAGEDKVIGDLGQWWPMMFGWAESLTADYPGDERVAELWGRLIALGEEGPDKEALGRSFVEIFKGTRAAREFGVLKMVDQPLSLEFEDGLNGKKVNTKEWAGKPVVICFWSPVTEQGKAGLAAVNAVAEKVGDKAGFVGVAVGSDLAGVKAECERVGVKWPQWVEGKEGFGWEKGIGVEDAPRVWVVDAEGVLKTLSAAGRLEKRLERMGVK